MLTLQDTAGISGPLASSIAELLRPSLGRQRAVRLCALLELPAGLEPRGAGRVGRAELALALAALLFDDVTRRVPAAGAYATELERAGERLMLDHGALRTVRAPSGALPVGRAAFERLLVPLGYVEAGVYPLERLGMTGYAFAHAEFPEALPQYFVSELHPERFGAEFEVAVARVIGDSVDPLSESALALLDALGETGELELAQAQELLPELFACFGRNHELPRLEDYEFLAAHSPEMAWIATEGQVFNHATDRVADVAAVADRQRALGRPIKDALEHSEDGTVIQTALRAAPVERLFEAADGSLVLRQVPGSFHEFIQRDALPGGRLDLRFDSSNAQGIFAMTREEGL